MHLSFPRTSQEGEIPKEYNERRIENMRHKTPLESVSRRGVNFQLAISEPIYQSK